MPVTEFMVSEKNPLDNEAVADRDGTTALTVC